MFLEPVTENTVFKAIMEMKYSNATDLDGISANILKKSVNFIVYSLSFLVSLSLESDIFPSIYRTAKVISLFKKGNKSNIANDRPISLLYPVSKILEKNLFKQLIFFISKHNILNPAQHGFIKGKSAQSAILVLIPNLYKSLDSNKKSMGLFIDLSKAFNLVGHRSAQGETYGVWF